MPRKGKGKITKLQRRKLGLPEIGPLPPEVKKMVIEWRKGLGHMGNVKGKEAEKRFLDAWGNPALYPEWLDSVRAGTENEDRKEKTDAMMISKDGKNLRIQIKSKELPRKTRNKLRRIHNVIPVIVQHGDSDETIRANTLAAIDSYRVHMQQLAAGKSHG